MTRVFTWSQFGKILLTYSCAKWQSRQNSSYIHAGTEISENLIFCSAEVVKSRGRKKIDFYRWLFELPANLCQPICPPFRGNLRVIGGSWRDHYQNLARSHGFLKSCFLFNFQVPMPSNTRHRTYKTFCMKSGQASKLLTHYKINDRVIFSLIPRGCDVFIMNVSRNTTRHMCSKNCKLL